MIEQVSIDPQRDELLGVWNRRRLRRRLQWLGCGRLEGRLGGLPRVARSTSSVASHLIPQTNRPKIYSGTRACARALSGTFGPRGRQFLGQPSLSGGKTPAMKMPSMKTWAPKKSGYARPDAMYSRVQPGRLNGIRAQPR